MLYIGYCGRGQGSVSCYCIGDSFESFHEAGTCHYLQAVHLIDFNLPYCYFFNVQFDPDKSSLQPFLDELDITVTVLKKWLTEKANKSRTNMLRATMVKSIIMRV